MENMAFAAELVETLHWHFKAEKEVQVASRRH